MDLDKSGVESSGQMIIWGDNDLAQARSYRCSFCKRGFSNAQALGGHMNIHRKDRAKLKEFSGENLLSLDISKTTSDCEETDDSSAGDKLSLENNQRSDEKPDEENSIRRLPLFAEAPSTGDQEGHVENGRVELIGFGDQLDLELRLGPEPNYSKSKP